MGCEVRSKVIVLDEKRLKLEFLTMAQEAISNCPSRVFDLPKVWFSICIPKDEL
jgi:hypothetical protein